MTYTGFLSSLKDVILYFISDYIYLLRVLNSWCGALEIDEQSWSLVYSLPGCFVREGSIVNLFGSFSLVWVNGSEYSDS